MLNRFVAALSLLPSLCTAAQPAQQDIYVSGTSGCPQTGKGTKGSPYNCFQHALAQAHANYPSDHITFHLRGTFGETIKIASGGTTTYSFASILIKPQVIGSNVQNVNISDPAITTDPQFGTSALFPLPQGTGTLTHGIYLENVDNVTIDGLLPGAVGPWHFVIEGIAGDGIEIKNCNNVVVNGVRVQWVTNSGIKVSPNQPPGPVRSETGECQPFIRGPLNNDLTICNCWLDQTNLGKFDLSNPQEPTVRFGTEALTVATTANCHVFDNRVGNCLNQGIDFKVGTTGSIHNNVVEFCKSSAIYLNECGPNVEVYHNVVRYIGFYQEAVASGSPVHHLSTCWVDTQWQPASVPGGSHSGIVAAVGDLCAGNDKWYDTGTLSQLYIHNNEIYWVRGAGILVFSRWEKAKRCNSPLCPIVTQTCSASTLPPSIMTALHVYHNTVVAAMATGSSNGSIVVTNAATNSSVFNNLTGGTTIAGQVVTEAATTATPCPVNQCPNSWGRYMLNIVPDNGNTTDLSAAWNGYVSTGLRFQGGDTLNCHGLGESNWTGLPGTNFVMTNAQQFLGDYLASAPYDLSQYPSSCAGQSPSAWVEDLDLNLVAASPAIGVAWTSPSPAGSLPGMHTDLGARSVSSQDPWTAGPYSTH